MHISEPIQRRCKHYVNVEYQKLKKKAHNSRAIILFCEAKRFILRYLIREMHPLLGKALLRVGVFYAYGLFVAWIFTLIEKRDESAHDRMNQKLRELRTDIDIKYNMTDNDFDIFVKKAAEALATEAELNWTFLNSCGFAFAAITTIGKVFYNV